MRKVLPGYASWLAGEHVRGVVLITMTVAGWIALFSLSGWWWLSAPILLAILAFLHVTSEMTGADWLALDQLDADELREMDRVDLSEVGFVHHGWGITLDGRSTQGYYEVHESRTVLERGDLVTIHEAGEDAPERGTIQIGHIEFEFVNAVCS